jgi:beta-glucosidase
VRSSVSFTVKNQGRVTGTEIPQVYLTLPAAAEPGKRLVGFDRIQLAPGESRQVEVIVESNASNHPFSIWEVDAEARKIVNGQ